MTRRQGFLGWLGMGGAAAALLLLGSCADPKSGAGFRLPEGDADQGRAAFVRLTCTRCHTVEGETFAGAPTAGVVVVPLGGEVLRVRTYGQLVTSIINPQEHIVSPQHEGKYTDAAGHSLMPEYNKTMTVQELVDLVAFLQAHYRLVPPEHAYYPYP